MHDKFDLPLVEKEPIKYHQLTSKGQREAQMKRSPLKKS